jgi:cytochrome c-type biogenesis protein CcmE
MVRERIAKLGGEAPEPSASSPAPSPGAAIAAMPPAERETMIRGMVEGLAARLAANGGSLDEWSRLVRAYTVLHEPEKARLALGEVRPPWPPLRRSPLSSGWEAEPMTRKGRRLTLIASMLAVLGVAAGLVLFAMRDSIVFFYGPSELAEKTLSPGTRLRIGGLVKDGSVVKGDNKSMSFVITDSKKEVRVAYVGQVPDLFREGQGVVAEGVLVGPGQFRADSVLAKHDEKYMPREVADALKKQGVWNDGAPAPAASK